MKKLSLLLAVLMVVMVATPVMAETKVDGNQVTFTFKAPNANQVYLSGNFNGWSPTGDKMTKNADGVWSVTIKLKPGTYQYKFVVDGVWTADESAVSFVDDGFGGKNSILIVKSGGSNSTANSAQLDALAARVAALEESQKASGFSFHGYARSGYIVNTDGTKAGKFGPSGAWAQYRLGNEPDTFIENTLEKRWKMDDGSYGLVHFLYCHQSFPRGSGWEPLPGDDNETGWFMREAYGEIGNLPDLANLTFWAGKRYYRRDDIHMNDWFWRDFTGIGAGVQGIPLGNSTLDIAWMFHGADKYVQQLIFTVNNIKLGAGSLDIDFAPTFQEEDDNGDSGSGIALAGKYSLGSYYGFAEGSSMIGFYYGDKIANNPQGGYQPVSYIDSVEDAKHYRLLSSGVAQITDNFEVQSLLSYQTTEDAGRKDDSWISIGARPVYHFNKNFALAFEAGHDIYDDGTNDTDATKLTLCPTFTLDKGYYQRPQIRVFVNRYLPNVGDDYTTYGVQFEAWW